MNVYSVFILVKAVMGNKEISVFNVFKATFSAKEVASNNVLIKLS